MIKQEDPRYAAFGADPVREHVLVLWLVALAARTRRPRSPASAPRVRRRPTDGSGRSTAIIGGGGAGLVTAKALLIRGVACTAFERNAVLGGVWADGYSNFGVQVRRELYELPDWPLPPDAPDFTPGPVTRSYLADYAGRYGLQAHWLAELVAGRHAPSSVARDTRHRASGPGRLKEIPGP